MSIYEFVRSNIQDIDFLVFAKHFKYKKEDEKLAWDQYTSALATLSINSDNLKNQIVDTNKHHLQFSKFDKENKLLISNEICGQTLVESGDEDEDNNISPCVEASIRRERKYYQEKIAGPSVPTEMYLDVGYNHVLCDNEHIPKVEKNSLSNQINKKSNSFTDEDYELFLKQYNSMVRESKWRLKSGIYIEDIMFDLGKHCKFYHPLHSFIFDTDDSYTCSEFTNEELEEICTENCRDLPDLNPELLKFISTFVKTSTREIREELNHSHVNLGSNYETSIHYSYDHVKATIGDWVRLIEKSPNLLTMNLSESWFCTNVWRVINNAFGNIPYVFVVGREVGGIATSERKNRYRMIDNETPIVRKKVGKRGDGFVRSLGTQKLEWAASEAGSGFSLPRQLKDIFIKLARKVNFDVDKIRQINVPRFIYASWFVLSSFSQSLFTDAIILYYTSGAILIKVNLDNPKGYVMCYVRDTPCEVYADVKEFPRSLDALITILYAKETVLRTMNVVKSVDEHHEDEALKWWKCLGKAKRKLNRIELSDCHPTPIKNCKPRKMQKNSEPDNE
ncbi:7269_t:CDS:10 [Scutellospora calospora]|uniref:7269_t:CDS:1 n=1 Tax=Scutellospora calospora TaxID=85575 RepID=A0ACA9L5N5_9GLOM|nr:7269_t:CDS:10 [Scutellospora calospora]